MENGTNVSIHWHNRLEKYDSEEDRARGRPSDVIEWEKDDIVPEAEAAAMGFDVVGSVQDK